MMSPVCVAALSLTRNVATNKERKRASILSLIFPPVESPWMKAGVAVLASGANKAAVQDCQAKSDLSSVDTPIIPNLPARKFHSFEYLGAGAEYTEAKSDDTHESTERGAAAASTQCENEKLVQNSKDSSQGKLSK
jgi:hypothetical protein